MLDHPDFNNISIENYKQEILPTFVLTGGVYVTRRDMSYFPIFYSTTTWSTFPKFMLALLFQISIFYLLYNEIDPLYYIISCDVV